ncbi:hypothetical protein GCM10009555_098340 [Acrocarpospora macrocephala]|uniref:Major facilitator superfamily (MFS) profile domain-containing protein n=2 Tax=Acrocarpospora macrocephala TaxID=150177 RepID=A0A5M3WT99_9ACTN|nr:hypothetical protein Amac_061820 [Acrocarpospora macrocephala]
MPLSRPAPTRETATTAQAALVAASFAMLLAGSNAVYPLLPVYRDMLGLEPFVLSLTFTLYVVVLVVALFALARPRFTRHAAPLLLTSLSMMIVSDLLMAHTEEAFILIGRALGGIAGGLGTGAASALVVAAIGARGRAVTATGNTAGGVLGFAGSQLVVAFLAEGAPQAVFLSHAAVVGALLIATCVVLWKCRETNRVVLITVPGLLAWRASTDPRCGCSSRAPSHGPASAWLLSSALPCSRNCTSLSYKPSARSSCSVPAPLLS